MGDLIARFRVSELAELKGVENQILSQRIKLSAVYGGTLENKTWAMATSFGAIGVQIDNPVAFNIFKFDDEVILDFTIVR